MYFKVELSDSINYLFSAKSFSVLNMQNTLLIIGSILNTCVFEVASRAQGEYPYDYQGV